jgi:hypothetical protein
MLSKLDLYSEFFLGNVSCPPQAVSMLTYLITSIQFDPFYEHTCCSPLTTGVGEDAGKKGPSHTAGENAN